MKQIIHTHLAIILVMIVSVSGSAQQLDRERLLNIASQQQVQWQAERALAEEKAVRAGLPVRQLFEDGTVMELQSFKDGFPVYYFTHNLQAAQTSHIDALWNGGSFGTSLDGSSEILGIWDGGAVRLSHQEFGGRVTQEDDAEALSAHATHVAGTMIAAGVHSDARGMSGNAGLHAYDWNNDLGDMAQAAAAGLRVSNHSYGHIIGWHFNTNDESWYWYGAPSISETTDFWFGFYNQYAQAWDDVVYNAPNYLIVKSAGNSRNHGPASQPVEHYVWDSGDGEWVTSQQVRDLDGGPDGYKSLGSMSLAKNILTVGAVNGINGGYSDPSDVIMSGFSSWGPTDDGRIKPDLVAKGVSVFSTISGNDSQYSSFSGTSMSSPVVAGSVGLLQEHYRNLYGPQPPLASTIKGLLIHTAFQTGNEGPDYAHGWGLLNGEGAARVLSEDAEKGGGHHLQEITLNNQEIYQFSFTSDGTGPLTATIAWTDPAGDPVAPQLNPVDLMLVNDLDLRIFYEDNTEYKPYTLDPSNPAAPAATGDNFRDNVEQVYIASPPEGLYTVQITHKGELETGSQAVSVIITGNGESEGDDDDEVLPTPYNLIADLDESSGEVGLSWLFGTADGFFEDFNDGTADNWVFSDDRFEVQDGFLEMSGHSDNTWASAYYNAPFDNFVMEFEVSRIQSEETTGFSIGAFIRSDGFGGTGTQNGYLINITTSGFYSAWIHVDGDETNLIPWTETEYVNTALGESNIVTINADGSNFDIYINGNFVDSFHDATHAAGFANVAAFDASTGESIINWDYVLVSTEALLAQEQEPEEHDEDFTRSYDGSSAMSDSRSSGISTENTIGANPAVGILNRQSPELLEGFLHFNIYRDGSVIMDTEQLSFMDHLPAEGIYEYEVTAVFESGESAAAGVIVDWQQAEAADVTGIISDASTGLPIEGALVAIADKSDTTDENGIYTISGLPSGELSAQFSATPLSGSAPLEVQFSDQSGEDRYMVTVEADNYAAYTNMHAFPPENRPVTLNIPMSADVSEGELRIVLTWGADPEDLDSHLKTPSIEGSSYHIYYGNRGSLTSAPYAQLDQDVTNSFGPETITIADLFNGTYRYFVHRFSGSGTIASSGAEVRVYDENGLKQSVTPPSSGSGDYWHVFNINGDDGSLNLINEIGGFAPEQNEELAQSPGPEKQKTDGHYHRQADSLITGWSWEFGDGITSDVQNPVHTYMESGVYSVSLTVSTAGETSSITKTNYIAVGPAEGIVVWPGDTHNNGFVDASDILPIGLYYGQAGPADNNPGIAWEAFVREPWESDEDPARVYADANGDGIINSADVLAVGLNYGLSHGVADVLAEAREPDAAGTESDGTLSMHPVAELSNMETLALAIHLDTREKVYGISYKLHIEENSGSIDNYSLIEFEDVFGSNQLVFSKHPEESSFIDIALSHSEGQGIAGHIPLMQLMIAFTAKSDVMEFRLEDIAAVTAGGEPLSFASEPLSLNSGNLTGLSAVDLPLEFDLFNNYPNPFNPTTQISYALPEASAVQLAVYSITGQRIATLVNEMKPAGYHTVTFDGAGLASGVYFYHLEAGSFIKTSKLTLIK